MPHNRRRPFPGRAPIFDPANARPGFEQGNSDPFQTRAPQLGGAFGGGLGDLFLQEEPQAAFFGRLQGLTDPRRRRFFEDQFQPTFNQFQGQLGSNLQAGQDPFAQQSFSDFLGDFDFNQAFFRGPIRGRQSAGPGNARFFGF